MKLSVCRHAMLVSIVLIILPLSLPATTLDGIVYAADFSGADIGAQVNAAIASCSAGCTVLLPKGTLNFSTQIVMWHGISVVGQGTGATILNWTGPSSTSPIKISMVMRTRLRNFALNRNSSITAAPAIEVYGAWDTQIEDIWCTANGGVWQENAGFQGCLWITGSTQSQSCLTRVSNSRFENYAQYSVKVDHAIDVYLTGISNWSYPNNTTADGLVIDSEVGGLHADQFSCGYGRYCLLVRNTMGGTVPHWLYFNEFESDTTTGGDGILFDSTLGSAPLAAIFINSWTAAAGMTNTGAVNAAPAAGLHIAGGSGITWQGRVRHNAGNGILISSNTSSFITIHDSMIYANNLANGSDAHGVYISGASTHVSINDNFITNSLDTGGQQKYGIKAARVNADQLRVVNNDLTNNDSGPYSSSNTGASFVSGNMPLSSGTQTVSGGTSGTSSGQSSSGTGSGSSGRPTYPVRNCPRGFECQ